MVWALFKQDDFETNQRRALHKFDQNRREGDSTTRTGIAKIFTFVIFQIAQLRIIICFNRRLYSFRRQLYVEIYGSRKAEPFTQLFSGMSNY